MNFFKMISLRWRYYLLYGVFMAVLIFILKWLQWKFLITDNSFEMYVGLIALFFTLLGIWVATQLTRKSQTVVIEKEVYLPQPDKFGINETELEKLNLSNREYDVLQLVAKGYSNADIAEKLFLSLSTVKTHVSNIYVKMDVKRRGQAIDKARRLRLVE